jgi:ATP-dependent Clp protease, protease subunit
MNEKSMHPLSVREKTSDGHMSYDIYSRLLKDRIVYLDEDFNERTSSLVISQLLYLDAISEEEITIYVNSPGGSVTAGLAIYDTMNQLKSPVRTVGLGMCASMGCFLLSAGSKGLRCILPSTRIMMHQVSSGTQGTIVDMEVAMANSKYLNEYLYTKMALHCGKEKEELQKDSDRDKWMSAQEAVDYGLADEVMEAAPNKWK